MANYGFSFRSLCVVMVFLAITSPTFSFILMRDVSVYPKNSKPEICQNTLSAAHGGIREVKCTASGIGCLSK